VTPPVETPPPPHDGQSQPPAHGDLGFDLPPPARLPLTRLVAFSALVLVLLLAVFASVYLPRRSARAALEEGVRAASSAAPRVEVLTPKVVASDRALVLPGSVEPLEETTIYPRANGYVRKWLVDIGDKVTEGQLLAEIDIPEINQERIQARAQLAQARAQLEQAKASRDFSDTNLKRYETLVPAGVASQQDLDQKRGQARIDVANVTVAEAAIRAQQANLERLHELETFAKIVAPFAGTITQRTIERGALVTAGNGTPLFKLAATDPVRVFVSVPQNVAPSVKVGQSAKVTVREYPGKPFDGLVARTSGALDAATRTMTTEVRVPNPDNKLLTGMYAEVALQLSVARRVLEVPSTALFNDAKGLRVAVVDAQNKIHFAAITIERDTGPTIQIATGLDGSERVVKLANAELAEGVTVEVLVPHEEAKKP
jgi:RND family efflux transporter MFP subunit